MEFNYIIAKRVAGVHPAKRNGILAQLGEHLPYKQRVTGSSPVTPTIYQKHGLVVQLVRMPACHAGGRRFEPVPGRQLFLKKLDMLVWFNGRAADL